MCDPGMDELQKTLKRHDRLNELEAFLKKAPTARPPRHWWLVHAPEIRRLLAPFDESIKPGPVPPLDRRKAERRRDPFANTSGYFDGGSYGALAANRRKPLSDRRK